MRIQFSTASLLQLTACAGALAALIAAYGLWGTIYFGYLIGFWLLLCRFLPSLAGKIVPAFKLTTLELVVCLVILAILHGMLQPAVMQSG